MNEIEKLFDNLDDIPIINRHKTPKEKALAKKRIQELTATPEEEEQLKQDILNGKFPGYVDKNGNPQLLG